MPRRELPRSRQLANVYPVRLTLALLVLRNGPELRVLGENFPSSGTEPRDRLGEHVMLTGIEPDGARRTLLFDLVEDAPIQPDNVPNMAKLCLEGREVWSSEYAYGNPQAPWLPASSKWLRAERTEPDSSNARWLHGTRGQEAEPTIERAATGQGSEHAYDEHHRRWYGTKQRITAAVGTERNGARKTTPLLVQDEAARPVGTTRSTVTYCLGLRSLTVGTRRNGGSGTRFGSRQQLVTVGTTRSTVSDCLQDCW